MKMEAEGGGGGNSVTGNSSDSGSGGIIDVSTVSSNFNAPTPQTSGSKNIVLSWYFRWTTEESDRQQPKGRGEGTFVREL